MGVVARAAAQLRLDAGDQFEGTEGFGDIIVRAEGEAVDFVDFGLAGSEHEDGIGMLFTDAAA